MRRWTTTVLAAVLVAAATTAGGGAAGAQPRAGEPSAPVLGPIQVVANGAIVPIQVPATSGGSPLVGYKYTVGNAGGTYPLELAGPTATSLEFGGLPNGQTFTFRVFAYDQSSKSSPIVESAPFTPQAWLPFASTPAAIDRLHRWVVGRAPTASEQSLWAGRVAAGWNTGQLVAELRRGADNVTRADPVARLYAAYFLRIPDAPGLTHWIGRSRAGTSLAAISRAFAGSAEFKARYGALTNRQFVELIYQNILGRPGEASGVAFWTGQLNSGKRGRGEVMIGFSESQEYRKAQAPKVDAALLWILLAGRAPTTAERDATALLTNNLSIAARVVLRRPEVVARAT